MATFGSSSSASVGSSGSVSAPSGTVSGSYLVAVLLYWTNDSAPTQTFTGGTTWTLRESGGGLGDAVGLRWYVYQKLAGASEPASYNAAITPTGGGNVFAGSAHVIRAVTPTIQAPVVQVTLTTGAGNTVPTPGITPPDEATLEVRFAGFRDNSSASYSWNTPVATPALTQRTSIVTQNCGSTTATRTLSSGAATGTETFSVSAGSATSRVGITIGVPDSSPQTVTVSGITSGETFGTAQLGLSIVAQGIASGQAFGATQVATPDPQFVAPSAIASGEAFGTLRTRLYLGASGIASAEALGLPRLAALIRPSGIPSAEAHGLTNVAIEQFITPPGVISGEVFGLAVLQLGYPQEILVEGIESGELVEDPSIRNVDRLVLVPPSIQETPVAWDALNIRFGIHRGITIMRDAEGVWRTVRYPAQTEIEEAMKVYLGGRRHVVTLDEANELIAAGYGAYISLEPDN